VGMGCGDVIVAVELHCHGNPMQKKVSTIPADDLHSPGGLDRVPVHAT
jgi:hypothetical protein